jgi:2-polyprenyl-6-methoxyphenol hydroxylase-like FAD-dependent oxidoreductase
MVIAMIGGGIVGLLLALNLHVREKNDWNQPGNLADFYPIYRDWRFDWLDVAELIRTPDQTLEYPMVDKNPADRWSFGRATLAGDAAHPMYPRDSNGAA